VEFVPKCRNVLFVRCLLLRYLCVVASVFTCLCVFVIACDISVRGANILVFFLCSVSVELPSLYFFFSSHQVACSVPVGYLCYRFLCFGTILSKIGLLLMKCYEYCP